MLPRAAILALAVVWAAGAGGADRLTPEQQRLNIESFEHVWSTVRDKHWDPKLGGLDWQGVHDELRPRLERAATMEQAREAMEDMLSRLKQTHFDIVPAAVYEEMDGGGKGEGRTGIEVRVVEGRALVVSTEPDSPAAKSGVKPGWEIERVDGKPLDPGLRKIDRNFRDSTLHDLMLEQAVLTRLAGSEGSRVKVSLREAQGRNTTIEMERARPRGAEFSFGNLPPLYFWVEARKARPDVGYIRFNLFFAPETLNKAVENAVKDCATCRGFVVDLRGNLGGIGGLAPGVAGWFLDTPGLRLGDMLLRTTKLKFVVFPRPTVFRGPLAILVDGCSASTSEIFAGGMQDLKRARVFGMRSAGAALPSMFERLPNGDGFQYAIANYISEGGKQLEGAGVIPDEIAGPSRRELLEGRDPALDRALAWIE
ncbi:MAG TPA: S41 family peptidase, partial [Bryobacteraceae bacterium]